MSELTQLEKDLKEKHPSVVKVEVNEDDVKTTLYIRKIDKPTLTLVNDWKAKGKVMTALETWIKSCCVHGDFEAVCASGLALASLEEVAVELIIPVQSKLVKM
jgi:hypothetical protein